MNNKLHEAVMYDRFFEIQRQPHQRFEHEAGAAVMRPGAPWWVRLHDNARAGDFFYAFLREQGAAGRQLVAAQGLADAVMQAGIRHGLSPVPRGMTAYFLPNDVPLAASTGTLRAPAPADAAFLSAWIRDFYREGLGEALPAAADSPTADTAPVEAQTKLYVWTPPCEAAPAAMGAIAPAPTALSRLNFIFVPNEKRRAGVGRALVIALCHAVRAASAMPMLYVYENNDAAVRLYRRVGFVQAGALALWTL